MGPEKDEVTPGLFGAFGRPLDYERMERDDRDAAEAHMRHCGYGRGMRGKDV